MQETATAKAEFLLQQNLMAIDDGMPFLLDR
jgi:hypothetical protein